MDYCGYPHEVEEILPPTELIATYRKKKEEHEAKIEAILKELTDALERK